MRESERKIIKLIEILKEYLPKYYGIKISEINDKYFQLMAQLIIFKLNL